MRLSLRVLLLLAAGAAAAAAPPPLDERLAAARELYLEDGPQAALPRFAELLEAYRGAGDRRGEALTLGYIGNCHKRLGDYPLALELLGRALALKRQLGDRPEEGKTLSHLGLVYWNMGDYPAAIDHFEQSIRLARELGDARLEGSALNNLSLVYDEQGDYTRSLDGYERALELYREIDFPRGEGDTLGNIGGVHLLLGHYREAAERFGQALAISERLGLKAAMSIDLGNLAAAQTGLGEIDRALATFERALTLARQTGLRKEEAVWLQGRADAFAHRGRYDEARASYEEALATYEAAGLQRELIEGLNRAGNLHLLLGDAGFADRSFRRALELAGEIGHPLGVTTNLLALGDLERRRSRFEEAAGHYRQAVERARQAGLEAHLASGLVRLALTERDLERLGEARDAAGRALATARRIDASPAEAEALYALAEVARAAGRAEEALARYSEARAIVDGTGDVELGWRLPFGRGQALELAGRDAEALAAYREAATVIERTRSQLREERFRSGYLGDKYQVYVALVRLLVQSGRPAEAFHFSEKLRASSYARLLVSGGPPIRSPELRRREAELRQRIRQLQSVLEEERGRPRAEQRDAAATLFSIELRAAERAYEEFLDDLRASDAAVSAAISLAVPPIESVQQALAGDAALLEYVVGETSVLVLVVRPAAVLALEVDAGRGELTAAVELLRGLILRPDSPAWRRPAARLGEQLLQPLEALGWLEGVERLYLVPHDTLHYLPFAALRTAGGRDGGAAHPLIDRYELVSLPSAYHLTHGRRPAAARSLLAMAPERANLRHAAREVRGISGLFPDPSAVVVGRDATEALFKSAAGRHSVLHLATHGHFNRLSPLLSSLELEPAGEEDGRLEVHEILDLELRASLVTLSACETALGGGFFAELPAGDDFVGLARAFLLAGSEAVMASLWKVNDRSTQGLMRTFYGELARTDAAAALARAQRRMRRGGRHAHPYYWAPFVLFGETAGEVAGEPARNAAGEGKTRSLVRTTR